MRSVAWKFWLMAQIALVSGCFSPARTRYPTWEPGDPRAEKRAYELHDPLPDRTTGPDTLSRPRGFELQRTEPRRALEGRPQMVAPMGSPEYLPPPTGPTGSQYPNAVPY